MNKQWLAMEHYRLHIIEAWPDGLRKDAALAAVHSAIDGLQRGLATSESDVCAVCAARRESSTVVEFPVRPALPSELAA